MSKRRSGYGGSVLAAAVTCLLAAARVAAGPVVGQHVGPVAFEIAMSANVDSFAQVYFDLGQGFEESSSFRFAVGPSMGPAPRRVPLPEDPLRIRRVRFDPLAGPGRVLIYRMALLDGSGKEVGRLSYGDVRPYWQIDSWSEKEDALELVTTPQADDPYVVLSPAPFRGPIPQSGLRLVRGRWLALIAVGVLLALAVAVVALGRQLKESLSQARDGRPTTPLGSALAMAVSLGMLVLGGRLWLIRTHGSSVFYLDSWHQIDGLFLPYAQGWLGWSEMFAAHNEHRIFFTRALDLALLIANRQWDGYLSTVVNAFLPAFYAPFLALILWSLAGRRHLEVIVASIGLAWTLPVAWENTLAGFQSQFYFLILFCVLALWLILGSRAATWAWLCGVCFAVWSLFTVASGLLTAGAIGAVVALRLVSQPERRRDSFVTLLTVALVVAVGVVVQPPAVAMHTPLRAHSLAEFLPALGASLAWPNVATPWLAIAAWAPLALLLALRAFRRRRLGSLEEFLLGVGLWTLLNGAAIAFGRGGQGAAVSSRYMDTLGLGLVVNAVSAAVLVAESASNLRRRALVSLGALAWTAVTAVGLERLTWDSLEAGAHTRKVWLQRYEENIRRFLATDDPATLSTLRFPEESPHWNNSWLANAWLRNPWVRHVLPATLRSPLPLVPRSVSGFVRDGAYPTTPTDPFLPSWGSFGPEGDRTVGRMVSQPVACTRKDYVRFEVAGYLGREALALVLESPDSESRTPVRIHPPEMAKESWVAVIVPCPVGRFVVVAEDQSRDSWFAFRPPTEMGSLSAWAQRLTEWDRALVWTSLFVLAVFWRRRGVTE